MFSTGTVRQTPEGEIRWTTFSIFHGEERWRSEGIQVGGLQSARGVLGNWFDKYVKLPVTITVSAADVFIQGFRYTWSCRAYRILETDG